MSRRAVPARDAAYEVVVGWDGPLGTFFAQVARRRGGRVLFWIGGAPGEVPRAEDLAAPLAPWAALTAEHVAALRADRAAGLDRGPSPLQRTLPAIVTGAVVATRVPDGA